MKNKSFDCVQMKRRAQEQIRAAVAGKDHQAEIDFFREGAEEFEQRIRAAKEALAKRSSASDA